MNHCEISSGLRKTISAQQNVEGLHAWDKKGTSRKDAQKDRPARPQRVKDRGVPSGYVEGLNDARTKLADFFSVLLVRHFVVIQPNMVSEFMDYRVAHLLNNFRFGSAET